MPEEVIKYKSNWMEKDGFRPKSRLWIFLFVRRGYRKKLLGKAIYYYRILPGRESGFISKILIVTESERASGGAGKIYFFDRIMAKGLKKVAQVWMLASKLIGMSLQLIFTKRY